MEGNPDPDHGFAREEPLEQKGPNNTVVYAHRYYPDNYAVGDPFIPPQEQKREPPAATYGLGPAYREQQPAPVHQSLAHHPQAQQAPTHHSQPAAYAPHAQQFSGHRPQNPAPYAPPVQQVYQQRPVQAAAPARQVHQPQVQLYGYGAQQAQAHNAQAQQAQRAYNQQQYQAQQYQAPPNHLYGASAAQRPRYAQQY